MAGERPRTRIGPLRVPERYRLPPRPQEESPDVQDAYRQSQFLLGQELSLFERGMVLQLRLARALARQRSGEAAALLALWGRAFAALADACQLLVRGSYASAVPLVRTACDMVAAQRGLLASAFAEWREWLAEALVQETEPPALSLALGRYRASSAIAQEPRLAAIYRPASELSQPHFGASALLTGPELALDHLPVAFAESSFHLGWAELLLGWLLSLCDLQLQTVAQSGLLPPGEDAAEERAALGRETAAVLARPGRCRVEEVDGGFYLVNFRRSPGGQPRRLLLAG